MPDHANRGKPELKQRFAGAFDQPGTGAIGTRERPHDLTAPDIKPLSVVVACGLLSGLALSGCANMSDGPGLSLPALPSVASISAIGAGTSERPVGSATDLYARVGRGAMACWFGANGPLKLGYIYHAEAEPASRGGGSEIIIHQREVGQPNPRGPKAYRIKIDPAGEAATIATENLKMPEASGRAMTADVERWSKGEAACAGSSAVAGWSPKAAEDQKAPAKVASAKKPKAKIALKPATP